MAAHKEISTLKSLLKELSNHLGTAEVKEIRNLLIGKQLLEKDLEECKDGLSLFVYLEKYGHIKEDNLGLLVEILSELNRKPLIAKVEEFKSSRKQCIVSGEPGPSHERTIHEIDETDSGSPSAHNTRACASDRSQHMTDAGLGCDRNNTQKGVLLINDEWGTAKGGISTINRQLAVIIARCNMRVYCTSLDRNEEDIKDAKRHIVELKFPEGKQSTGNPDIEWLTKHYRTYYQHLNDIPDIEIIIGHVPITSEAALDIRDDFFPGKKVYLFNHVIPRDIEVHKDDWSPKKVDDREKKILEEVGQCHRVFSVGPCMYNYFKTSFRSLPKNVKHEEFLPAPDPQFFDMIIEEPIIESEVNILTFGRVKGVANLKGYDIVAKAMSEVAEWGKKRRKPVWRIRGIPEGEEEKSKAYINEHMQSSHLQLDMRPYGTQDDIRCDIQQSHLVIMASRSEPFGMVGLEAIAAGIPVLITVNSGLAEFLLKYFPKDTVCQLILEVGVNDHDLEGDVNRWRDKIIEVFNDYTRAFDRAQRLKILLRDCDAVKSSHELFKEKCQDE